MKRLGLALGLYAVALGCVLATSARAYQAPTPTVAPKPAGQAVPVKADAQAALAKDATCTVCHNASTGHVSAVYESRHGNKSDSRTPTCQSCHGPSDAHVADPVGAVFNLFQVKS